MSELAIQNLEQHQVQLDEDGVLVAVSRQALNETLDYIDSLRKEIEEVKFALQVEENDNEYNCAEKDKLKEENERLKACLKFAKHALEPYDDVKPRNWLTDKDNLREAHQSILKILAPQIEGK
jgi:hypothetical protein